jgi:L-threonylcarbamoyladenylate synthase
MVSPVIPLDAAGLARATAALGGGAVIAIPTDTVYGLAALPTLPEATERIFAAKHRPLDLVLPVLVADAAQALDLGQGLSPAAERLMARHWPGPLTVVLERAPAAADLALGGGSQTIGLRCPDHDGVRELCALVGPLATTSANRHGEPPITDARTVADTFGAELALVLDGGECAGLPSTVVDCTQDPPRLLREGRLAWSDLEQSFGGPRP